MPKVTLTREALVALKPCDLPDRLRMFGDSDSMGVREAFDAGFTVADVLWVAGRLGLAQDCARVALFAAKQVAHFNPDPRVAAALEAAQRCIDDPTPAPPAPPMPPAPPPAPPAPPTPPMPPPPMPPMPPPMPPMPPLRSERLRLSCGVDGPVKLG